MAERGSGNIQLNKGFLVAKQPETKQDKPFEVINKQSSFLEVVNAVEDYKPGDLILVRDVYHQYEDNGQYLVIKLDDIIGVKQ